MHLSTVDEQPSSKERRPLLTSGGIDIGGGGTKFKK